ncbi:MAG: hypothetical protein IPI66_06175 [Chitinophagaceae bacterium]|nr:hypothetical protein [Chitinophagaceae bacterium]MBL0055906.1 hypothetical protein [Chitinophagaceae bacterium]
MPECQFNIPFTGETTELLNRAKAAIEKKEGNFTGDDQEGKFDITLMGMTVAGSYVVAGKELQVSIDSKPFFVPCDAIESYLKGKLFENN